MPCFARILGATLFAAALLGTACSKVPLGVYRVDVQQGNVLNEDMLAQLLPGMEKRKVRFLLGTPMLIDTFNQDRWDYIYTYSRGGGTIEQRQITLFFEDDLLTRIEGDVHRGDGPREVTGGETLVLVPEEQSSKGLFETFGTGLDFLRPAPESSSVEPVSPTPELQPDSAAESANDVPPPSEVARTDSDDPDTGSPEAPDHGAVDEDDEGWLRDLLQYLQPRSPSSPADGPESSSGTAPDRQ